MIDKYLNIKSGLLTAVKFLYKKRHNSYYEFKCDCGGSCVRNISEVLRYEKRNAKPANCGCIAKSKITKWSEKVGQFINGLEIVEYLGRYDNNIHLKYKCKCGTIKKTSYQNLLRTETCGCGDITFKIGDVVKNYKILSIDKQKVNVECIKCFNKRTLYKTALNSKRTDDCVCNTGYAIKSGLKKEVKHYRRYVNSAKYRRFKEFNIQFDDYVRLANSDCFYCGESAKNSPNELNGLDRVDSNIGYELDNVVPCCYTCNTMKLDRTTEYFLEHIKKILSYFKFKQELEKEIRKVDNGY